MIESWTITTFKQYNLLNCEMCTYSILNTVMNNKAGYPKFRMIVEKQKMITEQMKGMNENAYTNPKE